MLEISDSRSIPACCVQRRDWSTQPGLQCRQQQRADTVQRKLRTFINHSIILIIIIRAKNSPSTNKHQCSPYTKLGTANTFPRLEFSFSFTYLPSFPDTKDKMLQDILLELNHKWLKGYKTKQQTLSLQSIEHKYSKLFSHTVNITSDKFCHASRFSRFSRKVVSPNQPNQE